MIKIFIVDDHPMMSLGMKTWIESNTDYSVIGTAGNIEDTISVFSNLPVENQPDILIVDVDLGTEDGFKLVRLLKAEYPFIKILMYSMHRENGYVMDAKNSGANGYIPKDSKIEAFKACLEKIVSGQDCFDEDLLGKSEKVQEALKLLTPKEQRVLQEILKGHSNEEISRNQEISIHSVEIYVSRIYSKMDVHYREDLILMFNR